MKNSVETYGGRQYPNVFNLMNVEEKDHSYLMTVDIPGLRKEDVRIDLKGRMLTISGEQNTETKSDTGIETSCVKFTRSFDLPETVDVNHIKANFNHGVLQVVVPKTEKGFFSKLLGRTH